MSQVDWVKVIAALMAGGSGYAAVFGKLPSLPKFTRKSSAEKPDEHAELDALMVLQARAKRRGCPKLGGAVKAVEVAFFNEAEK